MKISLLALALLSLPLHAQTTPEKFTGIWSGFLTTQDHEYWAVEDSTCFAGCPKAAREFLTSLIDDPANDERPLGELNAQANVFMRDELTGISTPAGVEMQMSPQVAEEHIMTCHPYGYARQITNPLPVQFTLQGNELHIHYEEWNQDRTVYLDGRSFPAEIAATPLGYSIGRIDGDELVIETRGIASDIYNAFLSGGGYSAETIGTEHYTIVSGDPNVLQLEVTIQDRVTLTKPYVLKKQWIATPDLTLLTDSCKDAPGVF
ncbi:MAG: hypothetical protein V4628_08080 [Pseudomonadota bacterium]